jgi:hypothetical protein
MGEGRRAEGDPEGQRGEEAGKEEDKEEEEQMEEGTQKGVQSHDSQALRGAWGYFSSPPEAAPGSQSGKTDGQDC